jgi:hypothetical protein
MTQSPIEDVIVQPVEDLTPQIEYKQCKNCKEFLPITNYYAARAGRYAGKLVARCKVCHNEKNKRLYKEKIEDNGGGLVVPRYPNTYADELQKQNTFEIMTAMGWTFNENGVWSKDGIKDKDKIWAFRLKPDYVKYTGKDKQPVYTKVRHKAYQHIDKINELLKQGYPLRYVCKEFGMARQTLHKMLRQDGKEDKD